MPQKELEVTKKSFKQYNINDPIYRAELSIFIGDTDKIKEYLINKIKIPELEIGDIDIGKFVPYKKYKIMIFSKFDLLTIIHETIHYAFCVMHQRGIPIKYDNDETITYYVEMTLKNIFKELKIYNKIK